ncbi:hypothetical protein [Laspinema olomoucense]|nr:hypothetical protein [Laspinema sp. D3c]MCT7992516.1 hypothetical protein [Laspinema sp. D3c]
MSLTLLISRFPTFSEWLNSHSYESLVEAQTEYLRAYEEFRRLHQHLV